MDTLSSRHCTGQVGPSQALTREVSHSRQCHVEVGAAAAPAGDLGEEAGGEQLLGAERAEAR